MENIIKIRGARQHNLKNIDLDIPKYKLVVFTGVSGSGKSSLAFDTIYAEGQRRYVESLSTYARQFLGIMEKPDIDGIEGLSPAISIEQKVTSKNPRSTVGTITEIYDYLRLLYSRIGHPHCPICGSEIQKQSVDQIVDASIQIIKNYLSDKKVCRVCIFSPVVSGRKGEFSSLFSNLKAKGYQKVRIDSTVKNLTDDFVLIKTNKHNIDVMIDRLTAVKKDLKDKIYAENIRSRLSQSVEQALELSDGLFILSIIGDPTFETPEFPKIMTDHLFSERFACPKDNIQISEIEPRTFSFNSPYGACQKCSGIGKILKVNKNLLFSEDLSITEGAIVPFSNIFQHNTWYARLIKKVCDTNGIDIKAPVKMLSSPQKDLLLYGTRDKVYKVEGQNRFGHDTQIYEKFTGIMAELERKHLETQSEWVRSEIEKYMSEEICPKCDGKRLKDEALSVSIDGKSIADATSFSILKSIDWIKTLIENEILNEREKEISKLILYEIKKRLEFLLSVGLEYLTLDRPAGTLSGGEAQRIRLASQIGSGLSGVLYILDEPTIGLHAKDNQKLIDTLKKLKNLGNTIIVVEHDPETMLQSDYIYDFGPGAGDLGGEIVAEGNPNDFLKNKDSITSQYLSGKKKIEIKIGNPNSLYDKLFTDQELRQFNEKESTLVIKGCKQYNLKNIDVEFPLSKFVVITGVSGSGKSTLLVDTLFFGLKNSLNKRVEIDTPVYKEILGTEHIDKVILIDQSPIGKTPRSNPATYTKVFDHIREVFSKTKDARVFGYSKSRFSFNLKNGRCEECEGQGQIRIEMQFMSDIWVKCDVCEGKRYNRQTLDVYYKGKNISDILDMSIREALDFFHSSRNIENKLQTLMAVGLGYMKLGQPATTLSGGESQRVKLASELSKKSTGKTVYILDEPTTGLHFSDIEKLLNVLKLLVKKGNSVFVIEHNMEVIKNADWIIDLGPEGGDMGGEIVAQGKVENIIHNKRSYTANYLSKYLK